MKKVKAICPFCATAMLPDIDRQVVSTQAQLAVLLIPELVLRDEDETSSSYAKQKNTNVDVIGAIAICVHASVRW